jgi:hypothetical protein
MPRTIEIEGISDDLLRRLDERARRSGVDRGSYVRSLIERAVDTPAETLAGLLKPVHDDTEARGLTESEVERFLDREVANARRERRTG